MTTFNGVPLDEAKDIAKFMLNCDCFLTVISLLISSVSAYNHFWVVAAIWSYASYHMLKNLVMKVKVLHLIEQLEKAEVKNGE